MAKKKKGYTKTVDQDALIKKAKEYFWEQKSDEIGHFLIVAMLFAFFIFALLPVIGMMFSMLCQDMGWAYWLWDSVNAPGLYPHEVGYFPCMAVGVIPMCSIVAVGAFIFGILSSIKSWIDSNMKTAFERAAVELEGGQDE